jgi:glucose-6-phosphate 1-dehydrogenase
MIERLLLFGATGDLAGRFLFPALAEMLERYASDVPSADRNELRVGLWTGRRI